jgi:hypothetical protein
MAKVVLEDESDRRNLSIAVGPRKFTGLFIELGTRAHRIRVSRKRGTRALVTGEGEILGREVSHPGTQEHPFLRPAFDNKRVEARKIARRGILANIRRVARR